MKILQNLEPKAVFQYFEEISNIPRGSGNEKGISDYLLNFGKELGLESIKCYYKETRYARIRECTNSNYSRSYGYGV